MQTPISQQLANGLENAQASVTDAHAALYEAIYNDPELSHKTRMVLIHLGTAARRHQMILDQMALYLEYLDSRCDIILKHATTR